MAVTVSLFNHTARRFADGSNSASDTYKINLYSAFTFDADATTKSGAETGGTQITTANGYTQDTKELGSVTVTTVSTNGAKFDANDVVWTATVDGPIEAMGALIYNDTDTNDPPVAWIDFGGTQSAGAETDFRVIWDASGIFLWTVS